MSGWDQDWWPRGTRGDPGRLALTWSPSLGAEGSGGPHCRPPALRVATPSAGEEGLGGDIAMVGIRIDGQPRTWIFERAVCDPGDLDNSSPAAASRSRWCLIADRVRRLCGHDGRPMATSQDFDQLGVWLQAHRVSPLRCSLRSRRAYGVSPRHDAPDHVLPGGQCSTPRAGSPEQDAIAEVLGALDDKIAANTRQCGPCSLWQMPSDRAAAQGWRGLRSPYADPVAAEGWSRTPTSARRSTGGASPGRGVLGDARQTRRVSIADSRAAARSTQAGLDACASRLYVWPY